MSKIMIWSLAVTTALPLMTIGCSSTPKPVSQQNFADKLGSSMKSGTSKMIAAVTPDKKSPYSDKPMSSPSGKPGASVFVAAAQMQEAGGNLAEAETQYKKALAKDPGCLDALIGYARLEDRQNNFDAAVKHYQKAIKKHPKDPSVRNDLGLCYHRRGMLPDATRELKKAVELEGDSKLYRNNLAAVYVEQGMEKEAFAQLRAAHGEPVAHYNLGYLLTQKKNDTAALIHFQKAAEQDPNMAAAKEWIAKLSTPASPYATQAGGPMMAGPQAATVPANTSATYVAARPAPVPGQVPQFAPQAAAAPPSVSPAAPQRTAPAAAPAEYRPAAIPPRPPVADAMPPLPNRY